MSLTPRSDRPHMPGYGTKPSNEGSGLLPWTWAEERLKEAKNFWVATNGTNGQPHLTPVWAVWDGKKLLFTCAVGSRKARNLTTDPHCTVSTDDEYNPVVIEGVAGLILDEEARRSMVAAMNRKYESDIPDEFLAPEVNCLFAVTPIKAFGLLHDDFNGSPTRWTFD